MSTENINIGEGELEIMKAVWKSDGPITAAEIGRKVEGRGWKRTTIATFLARLTEKGALAAEKQGKSMYYTPLITAREYKRSQALGLVKSLFDGSAKELVASLFDGKALTDRDIEELRAIFNEREE